MLGVIPDPMPRIANTSPQGRVPGIAGTVRWSIIDTYTSFGLVLNISGARIALALSSSHLKGGVEVGTLSVKDRLTSQYVMHIIF